MTLLHKPLMLFFVASTLVGCGALDDGKKKSNGDLDNDGVANVIDCAPENPDEWQILGYLATDADNDGSYINEAGQVCTGAELSSQFLPYQTPSEFEDCDDTSAEAWQLAITYKDEDDDGVGTGEARVQCIGHSAPQFSSMLDSDCDDTDSERWDMKFFQGRDKDLDGFFVKEVNELCVGSNQLEEFTLDAPTLMNIDCDDTDQSVWRNQIGYTDGDADGFGTGNGNTYCIGNSLAANLAPNDTDCDDANSELHLALNYQAIDMDLDGHQVPSFGTECTSGVLSNIYQAQYTSGNTPDCDDGDNTIWISKTLYQDNDLDSYGAGKAEAFCVGNSLPDQWVESNTDCDDDNVNIWRNHAIYLDSDNDSYGDNSGYLFACIGQQPTTGYVFNNTDCDDTDVSIWRTDRAYHDLDDDGIGQGNEVEFCTDTNPAPLSSYTNYDCDDSNPDVFRKIVIYQDSDNDGVGAGNGTITCMGNSYLTVGVSIYGYDPEPNNPDVSNFDLSPAILAAP